MSNIINIKKSNPLHGKIKISGSKNGALPILAASILTRKPILINNLPNLTDVNLMLQIISDLGGEISENNGTYQICCKNIDENNLSRELVSKIRGSFLLAGPILARKGYVRISMPGGCPIGMRPIDLHLKGFATLGADITQGHGYIDIQCKKLNGSKIYLDFPSVGATENMIMASTFAKGETTIENASAEPEIIALAEFINSMGGQIIGAGTDTISIIGVDELNKAKTTIIPDRIEGGTYLTAFAITHGHGTIENITKQQISPVIAKLKEIGANITEGENSVTIDARNSFHCSDIKTMPFPGFPTDMQSQFMSLLSVAEGTSMFVETIFENRFLHVRELNKMGAKIKTDGRTAVVEGVDELTGAVVDSMDLRGGAALVLAGLAAKGETTVNNTHHIERGYENIVEKLQSVGANIDCE